MTSFMCRLRSMGNLLSLVSGGAHSPKQYPMPPPHFSLFPPPQGAGTVKIY